MGKGTPPASGSRNCSPQRRSTHRPALHPSMCHELCRNPRSLLAQGQEAARTAENGGLTPEASHRQRQVLVGRFSSPLAGEPGESPFPAPHLSAPILSCQPRSRDWQLLTVCLAVRLCCEIYLLPLTLNVTQRGAETHSLEFSSVSVYELSSTHYYSHELL